MKKIILSLMMIVDISFCNAQDAYTTAVQDQLIAMKESKSFEDFSAISNSFERIGKAEKTKWLPYYYAALCTIISNYTESKSKDADVIIERSENMMNAAFATGNIDSSEMNCLHSMILSLKIMKNPMVNGAMYGSKSESLLTEAIRMNPLNPRPFLLIGESYFYRPEAFGGSKKKAKKYFLQAQSIFQNNVHEQNDILPNWGADRLEYYLSQLPNDESK